MDNKELKSLLEMLKADIEGIEFYIKESRMVVYRLENQFLKEETKEKK